MMKTFDLFDQDRLTVVHLTSNTNTSPNTVVPVYRPTCACVVGPNGVSSTQSAPIKHRLPTNPRECTHH